MAWRTARTLRTNWSGAESASMPLGQRDAVATGELDRARGRKLSLQAGCRPPGLAKGPRSLQNDLTTLICHHDDRRPLGVLGGRRPAGNGPDPAELWTQSVQEVARRAPRGRTRDHLHAMSLSDPAPSQARPESSPSRVKPVPSQEGARCSGIMPFAAARSGLSRPKVRAHFATHGSCSMSV
jgi:hypothetical protein